jgi:broad specificity phosphatase PhoE
MKLKNQYFLLRHGENIYQTKKRDFTYPWPDNPPVELTKKGIRQIEAAAKKLEKEKIDFIYSSDIFRAKQSADIVARELNLTVRADKRLRDVNLGIFHNGLKKDFYKAFPDPIKRFTQKPKGGESWNDVKKRMTGFVKELEKFYKGKNILIVSHGDPLWILEGAMKGLNRQQLIKQILTKNYIKPGELRRLN